MDVEVPSIPALLPGLLFLFFTSCSQLLPTETNGENQKIKKLLLRILLSTLPQLNAAHQFSRLQSVTQVVDVSF